MATASYIIEGSFTSAGTAYDLQLPIQTVQTNSNSNIASTSTQPTLVEFEIWNYTEWAVASKTVISKWFKGMPAGYALNITSGGAAGVLVNTTSSSNGFTIVNNTDLFGVEIVSITKANPGVVTFRGPGFNPGQGIPAFATGDTFYFNGITGSSGTNWSALNGSQATNTFTLTKVSNLSFSFGVDTSGYTGTYTASSGTATRIQTVSGTIIPPMNVADVGIRLGTDVVGANADVMYWRALITDDFRALGQL